MEVESRQLLQSIYQGAKNVISKKDELNRINVFPVADGDTGTNLASLMQAIIDIVPPRNYAVDELLNNISSAALIGARGNSGIIFAHYLSAVAENYDKVDSSSSKSLVTALQNGVDKAYEALLEPREGTILSVMRAWAEALAETFSQEASLGNSLLEAQKAAEKALEETQFQLEVLKKNRLVDSGAKGFYYFISGLTSSFCGEEGDLIELDLVDEGESVVDSHHFETSQPIYRYCCEFILKNLSLSSQELKDMLQGMGDSLIIAGTKTQVKVHIHSNKPQDVLALLEYEGKVVYQKVDDMQVQYQVSKNGRLPIAVVTDSIADLPDDFIVEHQVHVIPTNILAADKNYLDKLTIDPSIIKEKLKEGIPLSTSQPTIQMIDSLFSYLQGKYDHVVVITVSSQLSGTYQLIKQRIKAKNLSSDWIRVVDSRLNSVAQGLVVKRAVELVETHETFERILDKLEETIDRTVIYVAVADLNPMIHSGRIPQFAGKILQALSLYPIVSLDPSGNGKLIGASFGQRASMKKIIKRLKKEIKAGKIEELAITHVCVPEQAKIWANQFETGENLVSYLVDSSASIAISAGLGSVAIAAIRKEGNL